MLRCQPNRALLPEEQTITATHTSRRDLLRKALTGTALGIAGLALPHPAGAQEYDEGWKSRDILMIHQLQAAFHLAKTTQNIDLMMSLYTDDAIVTFSGTPYVGHDQIKAFFLTTGSFTHRRFSLVPSFKIKIALNNDGQTGYLYFECFDIGDYDTATPFLASTLFLNATLRRVGHEWLFAEWAGGRAPSISVDQYFS